MSPLTETSPKPESESSNQEKALHLIEQIASRSSNTKNKNVVVNDDDQTNFNLLTTLLTLDPTLSHQSFETLPGNHLSLLHALLFHKVNDPSIYSLSITQSSSILNDGKLLTSAVSNLLNDKILILLMPPYLKKRRYFDFTNSYSNSTTALRDVVRSIIMPKFHLPLDLLHTTAEGKYIANGHKILEPSHMGRLVFNKRFRVLNKENESSGYREALGLFVEHAIRPLLWQNGEEIGEVMYQAEPTLRVSLPGMRKLGCAHIDYSYKRQPVEVNCWLPLSTVTENNTLYAETVPGAEDYEPFVAELGTGVLFYGSQCRHYSNANTTENNTRVSLDFRCVRDDHFIDGYVYPTCKDNAVRYKLGAHYTSTKIEREWRAGRKEGIIQEEEGAVDLGGGCFGMEDFIAFNEEELVM